MQVSRLSRYRQKIVSRLRSLEHVDSDFSSQPGCISERARGWGRRIGENFQSLSLCRGTAWCWLADRARSREVSAVFDHAPAARRWSDRKRR